VNRCTLKSTTGLSGELFERRTSFFSNREQAGVTRTPPVIAPGSTLTRGHRAVFAALTARCRHRTRTGRNGTGSSVRYRRLLSTANVVQRVAQRQSRFLRNSTINYRRERSCLDHSPDPPFHSFLNMWPLPVARGNLAPVRGGPVNRQRSTIRELDETIKRLRLVVESGGVELVRDGRVRTALRELQKARKGGQIRQECIVRAIALISGVACEKLLSNAASGRE
jgi:hypothetical protein